MGNAVIHFVGGGIENDESTEEAARREVIEETGYTDIQAYVK